MITNDSKAMCAVIPKLLAFLSAHVSQHGCMQHPTFLAVTLYDALLLLASFASVLNMTVVLTCMPRDS